MARIPLLEEHPRPLRFVLVVVLPAAFGAVTGYFLGVSETTYLVLSVIGIVGGVGAGYDHVGAKAGAGRGVIAGSVFGASILIAHEIHGATAEAHLPEPPILLVVVTTVLGAAFAAIGGWLRARSMRRHGIHPAQVREQAEAEEAARGPFVRPPLSPAPAPAPPGTVVDLNSGSSEEFRSLGMSVTQTRRIIEFREQNDGYASVDDLERVPGFSQEFLAQMKRRLTV
ncbi:MAG TPA: helix-hairpin-helix domain-containing protein [Solirubrobacterales bacterium]